MAALLATLTALFYGIADFAGGSGTKEYPTWTVVARSQMVGVPVLALGLLIWPPEAWSMRDFFIGGLAGSLGLIGLSLLYFVLANGKMAVAAPITGVVYLMIGLVADLIAGERPTTFQWIGIALAAVAVVLVSGAGGSETGSGKMLWAAAGAGFGFGILNVLFAFTAASSGLFPLAGARTFSIPIAVGIALFRSDGLSLQGKGRRSVAAAGVFDMGANLTILAALHIGVLSVVTAISGMYPAVTAVAALLILKERLDRRQALGAVSALVAVMFLAGVFGS